jgi:tRNA nucleotidyltransferase (CCA-adding enzyme)
MEIHAQCNLKTTLRVAGGWVRDKLMGKESDDIDIAVDDMTGKEFCLLVVKKFDEKGIHSNPYFSAANPAKGKYIETASMTIEG